MSTLRISVPKLHCERKTDLFGTDEVYLALIVYTAKLSEVNNPEPSPGRIAFAGVSPLNTGFRRSVIKELVLTDAGDNYIDVDLHDADAFAISFGLFEKDNGQLYEELKQGMLIIPSISNPSLSSIFQSIIDQVSGATVDEFKKILLSVATLLFRELRRDDLIGMDSFTYAINDSTINFDREFQGLRGMGGKYNVQFRLRLD